MLFLPEKEKKLRRKKEKNKQTQHQVTERENNMFKNRERESRALGRGEGSRDEGWRAGVGSGRELLTGRNAGNRRESVTVAKRQSRAWG